METSFVRPSVRVFLLLLLLCPVQAHLNMDLVSFMQSRWMVDAKVNAAMCTWKVEIHTNSY